MIELSKKEKKLARGIIEKGVLAEFKISLEKAEAIIKEWRNDTPDNSEAYHKLFESINKQNKEIASRYDGLGGSKYLITVAAILYEGYITEDEIKDFSEEAKQKINIWISFWKGDE